MRTLCSAIAGPSVPGLEGPGAEKHTPRSAWVKEKAPSEGVSLGLRVWGAIKRKPRLGARGFQ